MTHDESQPILSNRDSTHDIRWIRRPRRTLVQGNRVFLIPLAHILMSINRSVIITIEYNTNKRSVKFKSSRDCTYGALKKRVNVKIIDEFCYHPKRTQRIRSRVDSLYHHNHSSSNGKMTTGKRSKYVLTKTYKMQSNTTKAPKNRQHRPVLQYFHPDCQKRTSFSTCKSTLTVMVRVCRTRLP